MASRIMNFAGNTATAISIPYQTQTALDVSGGAPPFLAFFSAPKTRSKFVPVHNQFTDCLSYEWRLRLQPIAFSPHQLWSVSNASSGYADWKSSLPARSAIVRTFDGITY